MSHQPELHPVLAHRDVERDGRRDQADCGVGRQHAGREGPFDPGLRVAHLTDVKQELTHLAPSLVQAQNPKYTTGLAVAGARAARPPASGRVKT